MKTPRRGLLTGLDVGYGLGHELAHRPSNLQPDIHRYQQHCVAKYGLMRYVRLNTEARCSCFEEDSGLWRIETSQGD